MTDINNLSPGVRRYVEAAQKASEDREAYIRDMVKKWKFDTIAVHGLYSVQEALDKNQGAIIEPIFMSSSQAWHDADEMEAAFAYLIPGWAYRAPPPTPARTRPAPLPRTARRLAATR